MPRPPAPQNADPRRAGPQANPQPSGQPGTQRKGWPFAEGSQNHLDETSAPWPRPSRPAPVKPTVRTTPDQPDQ